MALDKKKLIKLFKKIADFDMQNESYALNQMMDDEGNPTDDKLSKEDRIKFNNVHKFADFMRTVKIAAIQSLAGTAFKTLKENDLENMPDWLMNRFDKTGFESWFNKAFTNEELDDFDMALDHCIELKKTANPEKPLISDDFNDKDNPTVKDNFWQNYGRKPFDKEDIEHYSKRLLELQGKGIDIHEYDQWHNYSDYKRKNNISDDKYDPITLLDMISDPDRHDELLDEEFKSKFNKASIDKFLNTVDKLYNEKGEQWADFTDKEDYVSWIRAFKMPAYIEGKEVEQGVMEFGVSMGGVDRDNAANYDETLFKKAKEYFNDPEHQKTFNWLHEKALLLKDTKSQDALNDAYKSIKGMSEKSEKRVNELRHVLYDMKENYKRAKAIKLGDDKHPKFIDEFEKGDNVTADRINNREQDALDACYQMLKNARSPKWNSGEYNKIMTDIVKAKKVLQNKELSPEAMNEQYKNAVKTVIGDIANYYAHKAVKGETEFSTNNKYKALFRVEKLMKSRFDGMTPEKEDAFDVEFNTGGAFSINDDDIDPKVVGDEYAKQATQSKVKNLVKLKEKRIEERKTVGPGSKPKEPAAEKVIEKGRKSMGSV